MTTKFPFTNCKAAMVEVITEQTNAQLLEWAAILAKPGRIYRIGSRKTPALCYVLAKTPQEALTYMQEVVGWSLADMRRPELQATSAIGFIAKVQQQMDWDQVHRALRQG